jgi:hypothetical protein
MAYSHDLYQSRHNFVTGLRVEEALIQYDHDRFDRISVTAFCGIVELTGSVSNYFDKALAIKLARAVPGISTVVESLQIRPLAEVSIPAAGLRRRRARLHFKPTRDRLTTMGRTN